MSKPTRLEQRSVEDVLRGSLADIAAGRLEDFDAFLAAMDEKLGQRAEELQAESMRGRISPSGP